MQAEPSPTTGTINMSSMMSKIITSGNSASPRDNCVDKLNEDKGSSEFEFKPLPNSSIQSMVCLSADCPFYSSIFKDLFNSVSMPSWHHSFLIRILIACLCICRIEF